MKKVISKEIWQKAEELRAKDMSCGKIAKELGILTTTVESHFRRIQETAEIKPPTTEETIHEQANFELNRSEIKIDKAAIKRAAGNKIVIDQLIHCSRIVKPFPIKRLKIPDLNGRSKNTTPILMLSDIHTGTFLKSESTGGLNYYSKEKLSKQMNNLRNALVTISIKQLAEYPLLKIHSLGDLLEGINIFKGQAFQIDMHLKEQYYYIAELMSTLLIELLQLYKEIEISCVPGNHGRIGMKGDYPVEDNFEYFWYRHMEQKMQNYPRIKWNISETWWMLDKTYDKTSLIFHGDGIRSWNSIPYYGIERADAKYTKLLASQKNMYQILELGHFHSLAVLPSPTGNILVNGCFVGGSMLALKNMVTTSEPAQLFFGIHKDLPAVNWFQPIALNYPKEEL